MLRNYLSAALRNLARNRLHSAITTISLAVGFAAVILATLFWRYEHSYDRFWPNADRIYMAVEWVIPKEGTQVASDTAPSRLLSMFEHDVPGIEAATRLAPEGMKLTHAQTEAREDVYWADLNFFDVMRPKAIAGDLKTALTPGSVVLTKALAQKYYGDQAALGQTLTMARQGGEVMTATVSAVIENLPSNSHLDAKAFVAVRDRSRLDNADTSALTYLRVRQGVTEGALAKSLEGLSRRLPPVSEGFMEGRALLKPLPLTHAYLMDGKYNSGFVSTSFSHGSVEQARLYAALGALILAIAAINFVTLMTARGARRAVEVGVRKAAGARRRDLIVQFMGEGLVYTALALIIALALVEFALPLVAANTDRPLRFDYLRELPLIGVMIAGAAIVGVAAGLYPAIALSTFKPASVLKGGLAKTPGSARLRQILIGVQFTPLIFLAIAALTLGFQARTQYNNSLKMIDPEAVIVRETCTPSLQAILGAVPGVRSVTCLEMNSTHRSSAAAAMSIGAGAMGAKFKVKGKEISLFASSTDAEGLEFYDLQPVAGRLWAAADDQSVIVNEGGARALGYPKPQGAIGATIEARRSNSAPYASYTILGVVPDRGRVKDFEDALYFHVLPTTQRQLSAGIKLARGADPKAVLAGIDAAWKATGARKELDRSFYRDVTAEQFVDTLRNLQFLFACVGIGVLIATFGLFGLAAFLAEQRTKEVGVRKALGASRGALMRMLIFQFAKPVIVANVIAIPGVLVLAALAQRKFESGERYDLGPEVFIPVAVGSLLVAFIATFGHAWQVTGARPVTALRYE